MQRAVLAINGGFSTLVTLESHKGSEQRGLSSAQLTQQGRADLADPGGLTLLLLALPVSLHIPRAAARSQPIPRTAQALHTLPSSHACPAMPSPVCHFLHLPTHFLGLGPNSSLPRAGISKICPVIAVSVLSSASVRCRAQFLQLCFPRVSHPSPLPVPAPVALGWCFLELPSCRKSHLSSPSLRAEIPQQINTGRNLFSSKRE